MTEWVQTSLILCIGILTMYTLYVVHKDFSYYLRKDNIERFEEFSDEEKERIIKYWNNKIAKKIQKLADDVNNLSKEDFIKLNNLIVRRGYDDSRN